MVYTYDKLKTYNFIYVIKKTISDFKKIFGIKIILIIVDDEFKFINSYYNN